MSRRRLLLVVGAAALLGAGFALFVWLTSPTPGVSWDNFRRLRVGMPKKDVKVLLGEPNEVFGSGGWTREEWQGKEVVISLSFDLYQRLQSGDAFPPMPAQRYGPAVEHLGHEESLLDRIRRWLRL